MSLIDASADALSERPSRHAPQLLLVDGDDTLWPNNVFFEQATDRYVAALSSLGIEQDVVRTRLALVQRRDCPINGYGSASYGRNLLTCSRDLLGSIPGAIHDLVDELVPELAHHPVELFEGVASTLQLIATRHTLVLVTKGDRREQERKIGASGTSTFFHRTVVVSEKSPKTYCELVSALDADRARAWMIGDSPRSDILAALRAGLNAAFVPNPRTPSFEHMRSLEGFAAKGRVLLELNSFTELRGHF